MIAFGRIGGPKSPGAESRRGVSPRAFFLGAARGETPRLLYPNKNSGKWNYFCNPESK
jgi:hypothetical protein